MFLAIALTERGLSLGVIGLIIGAGMAGGAVATALVGARIDQRIGRRRLLIILAVLGAAGLAMMAAPLPAAALVGAALLGMVNGMGRDRGGLGTLEQAILPDTSAAGAADVGTRVLQPHARHRPRGGRARRRGAGAPRRAGSR